MSYDYEKGYDVTTIKGQNYRSVMVDSEHKDKILDTLISCGITCLSGGYPDFIMIHEDDVTTAKIYIRRYYINF